MYHGDIIAVNSTVIDNSCMARKDPQFQLRLPSQLKKNIEEKAKESKRSINAEIVHRLQKSFGKAYLIRLTQNPDVKTSKQIAKVIQALKGVSMCSFSATIESKSFTKNDNELIMQVVSDYDFDKTLLEIILTNSEINTNFIISEHNSPPINFTTNEPETMENFLGRDMHYIDLGD